MDNKFGIVPNNGDFVIAGFNSTKCIIIIKNVEYDKFIIINYHAICIDREDCEVLFDSNYVCNTIFRFATEEEKQRILSKIHDEGRYWDENSKEIIKLK